MPEPRISSSIQTPGASSPGSAPHLRHRGFNHSATTSFVEPSSHQPPGPGRLRRSSTFSDTVSEARNSIKSSTDNLFLPRVSSRARSLDDNNESNWQSVPLALALLPAVGGLLFQNGSAVATDITLLVLAAVFLNWSIRLPWEWYRSAQEMSRSIIPEEDFDMDVIIEEPEESEPESDNEEEDNLKANSQERLSRNRQSEAVKAAIAELRRHEVAALASFFLLPLIGAWLLHALRSQLSRPSEGLVSNYNLTVFLLAAEIRPLSHLLKMVQARTLHLQRVVTSGNQDRREKIDASKILDLSTRLGELEAHIAESASQNQYRMTHGQNENLSPTSSTTKSTLPDNTQPTQPDLSALTRAMRRYEKRTALHAHETETRLQSLEKRLNDAIALSNAVAAQQRQQRSTAAPRVSPVYISLLNWICAAIVLPAQMVWGLCRMPFRMARWCLWWIGLGVTAAGSSKGVRGDGANVGKEVVGGGKSVGNGSVKSGGDGNGIVGGKRKSKPISISRELMRSVSPAGGGGGGGGRLQQREIGTGRLPISSLHLG
ncbi:uncharacterized protein BDCG_09275 [Blastomyces dermatitidis ER-3]|uniref:Uncharacterized protein n=1 Tax=Ajellomyces dermatitidis (strain ER-3 / ATCC MYA-2586) TaxID=559297 RepID=A0ABP2ETD6_AJEDR|nr:uncharacterized protein BDCG_09275 [Blastomyces dermatitidis ER-3]EEQ86006.1 hypothetical protein BDCG_09275 [Blastomyces dermatitidis ER-3]